MVSNIHILDCSSIFSALDSFSQVLQMSHDELISKLKNMQNIVEESKISTDETLYFQFFEINQQFSIFEKIAFFHLTRTNSSENFKINGVLPTRLVIEQIWNIIEDLVDIAHIKVNLRQLRIKLKNDKQSMYYHKLYIDSDGPYAFLTQETAFNTSYNHFLDCPEVIIDIIKAIDLKSKNIIKTLYQKNTKPYIVKFCTKPKEPYKYIGAALEYLYWYSINDRINGLDIGFDGEGKPIPSEQIVKITEIGCKIF
jgi:hypothetical protein